MSGWYSTLRWNQSGIKVVEKMVQKVDKLEKNKQREKGEILIMTDDGYVSSL